VKSLAPLALLVLTLVSGCTRREGGPSVSLRGDPALAATSPEPAAAPPQAPPPAPLPPLEGAWLERLELEGGGYAFVALPIGARDKRSIVVGVHGAGDRPDWSCSEWQAVTAGWAFVVCPVGVPHPRYPDTFVWGSAESIAKGADRAVAALRARYGAWTLDGPLVYGGWSQGATLAAQVIAARPGSYDRAVLVEVGHTSIDARQVAASLVAGGVRRAVVSCSSWPCRTFARDFEAAARRRGLPVAVNDVGLRGHWFDAPVFQTLGPKFVWMVEDERRYAGLGAAVDARYATD
jgi:pimeloyl-ACP methyl ester carboxylesterase